MTWKLAVAAASSLICCAGVAGCQTYEFEPVEPLAIAQTTQDQIIQARGARPELMLLVDKSGSMDLPIDVTDPDCTVGGKLCGRKGEVDTFNCDTSVCPTRWSDLQAAMASFIPATGNLARFGLATFPGGTAPFIPAPGCFEPSQPEDLGGAAGVSVDLSQSNDVPFELMSHANDVLAALQQIKSANPPGATGTGGGTPTGGALRMLSNYPLLTQSTRSKFVLLLTDGLPDCNAANPNSYNVDPVTCDCQLDPARCAAVAGIGYPREICLDRDNAVNAINELKGDGVLTIVIGLGAEAAAPNATTTLNAMAQAGGFARDCNSPNVCDPSESCDSVSHLCARRYFQASNATQLQDALAKISAIVLANPCTYDLDAHPASIEFVAVTFDGVRLEHGPTTWDLTPENRIEFFGSYCDQLKGSTSENEVSVSFRIVQSL